MDLAHGNLLPGEEIGEVRGHFLEHYGKRLLENGYHIIPIPAGSKSPGYDGWQNTKATPTLIREWLANGHADSGVGVLTKHTPAIDLDITDRTLVDKVIAWCMKYIGEAPVRIGRAPRALLVFRTETPFRKMKSGKYEDEWGERHEIEVLGDGQQFVAYAVHKDTHQPYRWTSEPHPVITHAEELPLITQEQAKALLDWFADLMEAEGNKRVSAGYSGGVRSATDEPDDPFADVETVVDLSPDECRRQTLLVGDAEDYERWIQVGMALYHQSVGDEWGLALWHEWSEVADNYDKDALDKHWGSFDIDGKRRAPITFRYIIKLAREAETTAAVAKVAEYRAAFIAAREETEWRKVCSQVRRAEIDALARAQIAEVARKRYWEITGVKIPLVQVKRELAYELVTTEKTPGWCDGWVYDGSNETFFHLETKIAMSITSFNMVYSRQSLTKKDIMEGRTEPSATPANLAMNIYRIPEAHGQMYAPDEEDIFNRDGLRKVNTYRTYLIPTPPKHLQPLDKLAITRVRSHIAHLLAAEHEQRLFLDTIAWIVQNPGKLLRWCLLLQGVQGDGKSFWGFLLAAVMGTSNVRMLNASVLESNFTGWGQGQCVTIIEEPRLQGQNKYDVLNKIKPYITNSTVEIHAKGRDPYDAPNTTNYLAFTNFRDAVPLQDNERRFCVLFSQWQSRVALAEFKTAHPTYYINLYRAIEECAPALRGWLLDHEISENFPAGGDAPITRAFDYMVAASTPETLKTVQEVIDDGECFDITPDLVNATSLPDAMVGRDGDLPQTSGLTRLLENNGYVYLGRIRIDGTLGRYWSRQPELFKDGSDVSVVKIRRYLVTRKQLIDQNKL